MKTIHLLRQLGRFRREDAGVSVLEYAMMLGILAVAIGAAITTFGTDVATAITNVASPIAKIDMADPGQIDPN